MATKELNLSGRSFKEVIVIGGSIISRICNGLRFCCISLLQVELNEIIGLWNSHRIRTVRNRECPSQRPLVIFDPPEGYGMEKSLDLNNLMAVKAFSLEPSYFGSSAEFLNSLHHQ